MHTDKDIVYAKSFTFFKLINFSSAYFGFATQSILIKVSNSQKKIAKWIKSRQAFGRERIRTGTGTSSGTGTGTRPGPVPGHSWSR